MGCCTRASAGYVVCLSSVLFPWHSGVSLLHPWHDHVRLAVSLGVFCLNLLCLLSVENLCLGLSPPLLVFHSMIAATIACLVEPLLRYRILGFPKFNSLLFYIFPEGAEKAI